MRKILLATTALVGFVAAGAAQAATSPLTVNVGGDVDFVAANFAEGMHSQTAGSVASHRSFESVYDLDFSVAGKTGNGIQYGGVLGFSNADDIVNGFGSVTQNSPYLKAGNVFMSGAFGKVVLGDSHGATDLNVNTPTVGEGQVEGRYVDFLDTAQFAKTFVYGVDGTDHSTNITYFTPKVGNENNKVQAGVSYIPQFYSTGSSSAKFDSGAMPSTLASGNFNQISPYHDVVKAAVNYTGNIAPVAVSASANIINGNSNQNGQQSAWVLNAPTATAVQGFTSWGVAANAGLDGFTAGVSYTDNGHYDAVAGQNKSQNEIGAGLKYEFSKYAVGVSYLGGEGYDNLLTPAGVTGGTTASQVNYIKDFSSYGLGGAYSWAPGLTSNLDAVYFDQKSDVNLTDKGYVLLVSQKLAF